MIGLWRRRYRESSRLTKVAFWVVIVSAVLGLCLVPFNQTYDAAYVAYEVLSAVMFVGLIFLIVEQIRQRRRS